MTSGGSRLVIGCILFFLIWAPLFAQPELKFAELGDFKLAGGEVIQKCRLGYRTSGHLNKDRSNAILFPTWFRGTSEWLTNFVGKGKLIDTTVYFVIFVDAFGNGVSSSPSNSLAQPDSSFPYFTVRDLVRSQYVLLTQFLSIKHLHAIIGVSMGGMQAFEWGVSYPTFAAKIIPIVGSPKLAAFDLLLWKTESRIIESRVEDAGLFLSLIENLLNTPARFNSRTARGEVDSLILATQAGAKIFFNRDNVLRQLRAMITHDVSEPFGGSIERAVSMIKSEFLVVVATQDRVVTPEPARMFSRLLGGKILELTGDCGHGAFSCEMARISKAVEHFLLDEEE